MTGVTRSPMEEKAALDEALELFMNDCRARLHGMVDKGKRGWDDKTQTDAIANDLFSGAYLALVGKDRLHLHDVAIRAMFLWWQEYHHD